MTRAATYLASGAHGLVLVAEVTRIQCCLAAAAYVVLGAYVGEAAEAWITTHTWQAALVVALIVAAAFVFNDVRDEFVDRLAKPERPIPSGRLSRRGAIWLALGLTGAALLLASGLGPWLMAFSLAYVALGAAYSHGLKNTILFGNLTMALLIGSIPIYGGLAAGAISEQLIIGGTMMFLFSLAQEILYTVEDMDGDRAAGLRTTATQLGRSFSLRLYHAVVLVFVVFALLPWILALASETYIYAVLVFTIVPLVVTALLLGSDASNRTISFSANIMRVVWLTSAVPFACLR